MRLLHVPMMLMVDERLTSLRLIPCIGIHGSLLEKEGLDVLICEHRVPPQIACSPVPWTKP
ncbi:hypothetical protein SADUNF_Sadunf05G0023800 [Salix dunnii]|uniref:Uncharacterized protein n=1 Tax=Salix dunnii TaxID=1413687 RepID=A0A835K429_9ROSI|nr:hypothetical protein SADUNF_Sadunf05G0023800 [Salix dunnii]